MTRFGTLPLADVIAPAIRLAQRGFVVTPYLANCVKDCAGDLASDPGLSALLLPGGAPIAAGARLTQPDYADSLRLIAEQGARALYGGPLGAALTAHMARSGGLIAQADLDVFRVIERAPVRGRYRDFEILGPPPPSSSGVHVVQMLNILEGYDVRRMGFGSTDAIHLLAEALKIAFADRAVATADPAFVDVPVDRLISKSYGDQRRARLDMTRAQNWSAGLELADSHNTTHVTVADSLGNVVSSTQTINGVFGACVQIPGTGMLTNNYMYNFDPHPGRALSIAPGKRVFTSMAPMMALRDGRIAYALGLPGGLRIFPSALQAIVNLIDHGMSPQEAVEAPRVWTEGGSSSSNRRFRNRSSTRWRRAATTSARAAHRRRHECDRLQSGRNADRRGLLARRRHAGRDIGRPRASRCERRHVAHVAKCEAVFGQDHAQTGSAPIGRT